MNSAASTSAITHLDIVVLKFEDKTELRADRTLLAKASTYFAAFLVGGARWAESRDGIIDLSSWSIDIVRPIIRCLETGNDTAIFENVDRYFNAINYFAMDGLMARCVQHKVSLVTEETVLDEWEFAQHYCIEALRERCLELLLSDLRKFLTDTSMNRKMPKDLFKTLLAHKNLGVANEDEVLPIIDLWCSQSERSPYRKELLHSVRFAHLTETAFNKCREDPECQEVPQFRDLLASSSWSGLGEDLLSGRNYARKHVHSVGFVKPFFFPVADGADGPTDVNCVLTYCSLGGVGSIPRSVFTKECATRMLQCFSVRSGNQLFYCHWRPEHVVRIAGDPSKKVMSFEDMQYFPDISDIQPSLFLRFPRPVFLTAKPEVVGGEVYIAHLVYEGPSVSSPEPWNVRPVNSDHFSEIELLRVHSETKEATPRRVRVNFEPLPWRETCCSLLAKDSNKLCVRNGWTMLLVPSLGALLALDRQPMTGPTINLPETLFEAVKDPRGSVESFSDMVIVGNVAYVLLKFNVLEFKLNEDRVSALDFTRSTTGSITAFDLVQGEMLDSLNLAPLFAEKMPAYGQKYKLYLKTIQNEVFFCGVSKHLLGRKDEILVPQSFVYRIGRRGSVLSMTSVGGGLEVCQGQNPERVPNYSFRWEGVPSSVDVHPCKHASMIQLNASRERDSVKREYLRNFTW